jgi:putative serine protease PepD
MPEPESHRARWWVTSLAAAALVGAVTAGFIVRFTLPDPTTRVCEATQVADRVLPSVVTIAAKGAEGESGTGTGEIIRDGGYILTNQHVIAPAGESGRLVVHYTDGGESEATLVGEDVATDLAVIQVEGGAEGRPVVDLGSSADLDVGRPVVALGAPVGLASTVTTGIVSALGRYVPVPTGQGDTHHLVDAIQTDAAINPGNSGGPLADCGGAMVGVNAAIATVPNAEGVSGGGSVGLGFAIPVGVAEPVAEQLIATGSANHPVIGLAAHPVKSDDSIVGLLVTEVTPAGPAEEAGLQARDLITDVDGSPARSADQLVVATLTRTAGETLSLTYSRDGSSQEVDLTLAAP